MIIEQPAKFLRWIYPRALWRMSAQEHAVYLTFDDGPIPEVTPWVLDVLKHYGVKATFFMVGDNVRKHPNEFEMVRAAGHRLGNHTFNHIGRDYSTLLNGRDVLLNVRRFARNGSIITFHDSLKSQDKLLYALPRSIEWLLSQGYAFRVFD